jgi:hypothetical protein
LSATKLCLLRCACARTQNYALDSHALHRSATLPEITRTSGNVSRQPWSFILCLVATSLASGQNVDLSVGKSVVDAYIRGVELRQRQEALELQKKQLELQQQRLRLLEFANRKQNRIEPENSPIQAEAEAEISQAFSDLRASYPDFDQYLPRFTEVMRLLAPQKGALTVREYVETVYVIAKYASFMNKSGSTAQPSNLPSK